MREWKLSFLCAGVNLKKWRGNAAACTIAVCFLAFALWNMGWLTEFCLKSGTRGDAVDFPLFLFRPGHADLLRGVLACCSATPPFRTGIPRF